MTFLPPGERIDGTTAECAHLHLLLACFRASPPPMRLPDVTGCPLPDLLGIGIIDKDVFSAGYAIMADRYERLGVRALLPLERVWTGSRSAADPSSVRAWGGFHHPAQGYRHIQMDAAITVYGDLTGRNPVSPQSAALDLDPLLHPRLPALRDVPPLPADRPGRDRPRPVRHQLAPARRAHLLSARRAGGRPDPEPGHRDGGCHRRRGYRHRPPDGRVLRGHQHGP